MSRHVKDLISTHLKNRLQGVTEALLVDVIGMNANANALLRKQLREKNIHLMVVKNSMARRAMDGTPLALAFEETAGTLALVWGGEDVISLAKEVARLAGQEHFAPFQPRGGVMEGARLSASEVYQVSRWPTRQEQLSLLIGQILSSGSTLSAQLLSPGATLASQTSEVGKGDDL